jgi:hypothetical protein
MRPSAPCACCLELTARAHRKPTQPYAPDKLKAFLEGAGVSTEGFQEYFAHAADVDNFPGGNQASIVTYRKVKRHFEMQALGL